MKKLIVFILFLAVPCFAGQRQIYKGHVPNYGDYYDERGQKYKGYIPQYGDKIELE